MKKILLTLVLLAGCAGPTAELYSAKAASCASKCDDYAKDHGYAQLLSRVTKGGSCVCRMLSSHSPDEFDVELSN